MKGIVKNGEKIILLLVLSAITLIFSYSNNDVFFTTQGGEVELTKEEYDKLLKVHTLEDLKYSNRTKKDVCYYYKTQMADSDINLQVVESGA